MKKYVILTGILIFGLASFAVADVTVETYTEIDMIGAGKIAMKQIQYIKGDRSYDESTTKLFGQMAASMGSKSMKTIQIVRLDKNLGWSINPDNNTYTEFNFEQMKANIIQTRNQQKAVSPMGEFEWKIEINKEIGVETILGFECKGIRAKSIGVNKNNAKDTVFITNEQWFTEKPSSSDEIVNFTDKMAEVVGNKRGFLNQMSMNPVLAKFSDQFSKMANEFESIKGISLKTVLVVEGSLDPMVEAMGGKELDEETKAMMKKMGMALPGETPKGGHHNIISLTSLIKKIEQKPIDNSQYEIPEGFKKQ